MVGGAINVETDTIKSEWPSQGHTASAWLRQMEEELYYIHRGNLNLRWGIYCREGSLPRLEHLTYTLTLLSTHTETQESAKWGQGESSQEEACAGGWLAHLTELPMSRFQKYLAP